MRRNISKELGLDINSHSQIEFVDITLNDDTKLFLDPCLIEIHNDKWALSAKATMDSFFGRFYQIYRDRESYANKLKLFAHTHEINATKFGYGNGNNGKAKTPEGMIATFSRIDDLIGKKINLSHPIDLPLLIENFAEDCLSDMLTNILFKVLNDFTLDQCEKCGVIPAKAPKIYYYWDYQSNDWLPYQGNCLVIDKKVILLVPKWFIRQNYYYNTSQYFSRVILEKIQQEKAWIDPKGKEVKPSKKSLEQEIIHVNKDKLLSVISYTEKDPSLLIGYHKGIPKVYADKGMKDEALDKILYGAA